jgi:hemerythrin-like domain-containing protein
MAEATKILRHEHEAILNMLGVVEQTAGELETCRPVRPEALEEQLEFLRIFADQCHHGKEERLLFPMLESKGIPREGGPIAVMESEHERGRQLIRQMSEALELYRRDPAQASPSWAASAREYARLLRQHIEKENNVLFRMAESVLTPAEQEELGRQFDRLEVEEIGEGTHQRLHAMMDRLVAEAAAHR